MIVLNCEIMVVGGLPKERTYVIGSSIAKVLCQNLTKIVASNIHTSLRLEKDKYILQPAHWKDKSTSERTLPPCSLSSTKKWKSTIYLFLYSRHHRFIKCLEQSGFLLEKRLIQHESMDHYNHSHL